MRRPSGALPLAIALALLPLESRAEKLTRRQIARLDAGGVISRHWKLKGTNIGTGKAATPTEAAEAHAWIRARVAETDAERAAGVRILYGGSVNPDNIGGFLDVPDVDGALIGGAALDPVKFGRMIRHAPVGA